MSEIVLQSTITCPDCGHKKEETKPTHSCQFFMSVSHAIKYLNQSQETVVFTVRMAR